MYQNGTACIQQHSARHIAGTPKKRLLEYKFMQPITLIPLTRHYVKLGLSAEQNQHSLDGSFLFRLTRGCRTDLLHRSSPQAVDKHLRTKYSFPWVFGKME